MRLQRVPFILLPFAITLTACRPQPQPLSDEDVAAIRGVVQSFGEAALAGDFSTAAESYAVDAVFMPPNGAIYEGRAAEVAHLEATPPVLSYSSAPVEVDGYGDLAYARGAYSLSLLVGADTVAMEGKWVHIFRKQPDGSWLITLDIWNSNDPLPAAEG
jgi:ketosteroid isomerase-like protein